MLIMIYPVLVMTQVEDFEKQLREKLLSNESLKTKYGNRLENTIEDVMSYVKLGGDLEDCVTKGRKKEYSLAMYRSFMLGLPSDHRELCRLQWRGKLYSVEPTLKGRLYLLGLYGARITEFNYDVVYTDEEYTNNPFQHTPSFKTDAMRRKKDGSNSDISFVYAFISIITKESKILTHKTFISKERIDVAHKPSNVTSEYSPWTKHYVLQAIKCAKAKVLKEVLEFICFDVDFDDIETVNDGEKSTSTTENEFKNDLQSIVEDDSSDILI